jgi:F-type H+-transporting ATPase subunit a
VDSIGANDFLSQVCLKGRGKIIPSTGQAIIKSVIEGLQGIMEPIMGKKVIEEAFRYLRDILFFIPLQNICDLLLGIGSIGLDVHGEFRPFLSEQILILIWR